MTCKDCDAACGTEDACFGPENTKCCSSDCLACSGSLANECLSCKTGKYLTD